MGHPPPSLDQARLREALITLLDHALPSCAQVGYRLVGTGAALLRGVQLPAADVDILVKGRRDVDAFASALSPFKCLFPPTWLADARQYYGNYDVNGVEVGISTVEVDVDSDTIETLGRGPWDHFSFVQCGPYEVPTVALELRLITELRRDRPDRYAPIIRYMQANGCNTALVRRAMDAAGLPQTVKDCVLAQL